MIDPRILSPIVYSSVVLLVTLSVIYAVFKPATPRLMLSGLFINLGILIAYLWIFSAHQLYRLPFLFMSYVPATISASIIFYLLLATHIQERSLGLKQRYALGICSLSWAIFAGFCLVPNSYKKGLIFQLYGGHYTLIFLPFTILSACVCIYFLFLTYWLDPDFYNFSTKNRKQVTGFAIFFGIGLSCLLAISTISIPIATAAARYGSSTLSLLVLIGVATYVRDPQFVLSWVIDLKNHYRKRNYLYKLDTEKLANNLEHLMVTNKAYRSSDMSLESCATTLAVSRYQLSQLLNDHLATTFSRYIQRYRVEDAMILLKNYPERTIISIAYEVGFNSHSVFQTAFRNITGMSPSEYRQSRDS